MVTEKVKSQRGGDKSDTSSGSRTQGLLVTVGSRVSGRAAKQIQSRNYPQVTVSQTSHHPGNSLWKELHIGTSREERTISMISNTNTPGMRKWLIGMWKINITTFMHYHFYPIYVCTYIHTYLSYRYIYYVPVSIVIYFIYAIIYIYIHTYKMYYYSYMCVIRFLCVCVYIYTQWVKMIIHKSKIYYNSYMYIINR